ncbi:HAD family hydrolase [Streptomyces sp. NPDC004658]|uniref:HAD family hydrolase n=1 Tax=Streptomyces sp. NPDC004658 TaxID=3154672 RepID=UPI0033BD8572
MPVIFFDVGATLADARVEPDGSLMLRPRPRVMAVLDALRDVPTGIISDPGPGAGAASRAATALHAAFPGRFTDETLVHWGTKDGRDIFDRAVAGAGQATAGDCVFVGEDARERAFAREAGMRTAADPVFARAATENRPVHRAWVELPEDRDLSELTTAVNDTEAVVVRGVPGRRVLAMATTRGAEALERAGFPVELQEQVDGEPVDDAERRASDKFISDLLARGEAVYEGEQPTPRTTHIVRREDDGRLTVRRLRFR